MNVVYDGASCAMLQYGGKLFRIQEHGPRGWTHADDAVSHDIAKRFAPKPTRARKTDPRTSREFAKSFRHTKMDGLIVAAMVDHGDLTMRKASDHLGICLTRVSPRFAPLRRSGQIVKTGALVGKAEVYGLAAKYPHLVNLEDEL